MAENQHIEYKQSWRDDYLKWICGFANAQGGVLEIGRNDKGEVAGLPEAARLLEELPNKVRDLLGIMVDVNLRAEGAKEYLEIEVEPYPNPISYRGEYYYRSGSTNQMLKGAALDRFMLHKYGRTWDCVPLPGVGADDLDAASLKAFREGWTQQTLLAPHSSQPHNPDIANTFFRAGEIEAWGRGIERMFAACREAGTPEPQIRFDGGGIWTEFLFSPEYWKALGGRGQEAAGATTQKTTQETPVKTPERILELLKANPRLTLTEIASRIDKSVRAVERATASLVKQGRLRYAGPRKGGHWEILKR